MTARSRESASLDIAAQVQEVGRRVAQVLDVPGLQLRLARCGELRTFAADEGGTVCAEFVELLAGALPDQQLVRDALLFTLLHAVARHMPLPPGTEPVAARGELASALMILFNQTEALRNQARHFAASAALSGPLGDLVAAPDHPLNPATAGALLGRLDDPHGLLRDAQAVLLPHMRTEMLERLHARPPAWLQPERIEAELARRRGGSD
jgi:hypothetical protein